MRRAIVWLPLSLALSLVAMLFGWTDAIAFIAALGMLLVWIGAAAYAAVHPHRGLHDRLAGAWVVRR